MDLSEKMKKCQDYMESLEEERRKIQVFHRELPLSLDLINQAIEKCRQRLETSTNDDDDDDCEEQRTTTSCEIPVLEEFIPLKRSPSSDFKQLNKSIEQPKVSQNKLDWLKSVQLWNQTPDPVLKEDSVQKTTVPESIKNNGDAFLPFPGKLSTTTTTTTTRTATTTTTAPSSIATSSTSETVSKSGGSGGCGDGDRSSSKREPPSLEGGGGLRKTRRCWSPELHRRFLNALQQLGGSHATPKQIRELMKVDGLTNDEVKSHLQKYRLHTRRPSQPIQNNGNSQPPQFVVVGGIWVPPSEYTNKVAATGTGSARVYTPVATSVKQMRKSPTSPLCNRGENDTGDEDNDDIRSHSPSISSSTTHTSKTVSLTL